MRHPDRRRNGPRCALISPWWGWLWVWSPYGRPWRRLWLGKSRYSAAGLPVAPPGRPGSCRCVRPAAIEIAEKRATDGSATIPAQQPRTFRGQAIESDFPLVPNRISPGAADQYIGIHRSDTNLSRDGASYADDAAISCRYLPSFARCAGPGSPGASAAVREPTRCNPVKPSASWRIFSLTRGVTACPTRYAAPIEQRPQLARGGY